MISCSTIPRVVLVNSGSFSGSLFLTDMVPESRFWMPHRQFMRVVFPAPLGPSRATNSPVSTEKVISSRAVKSPKVFLTW